MESFLKTWLANIFEKKVPGTTLKLPCIQIDCRSHIEVELSYSVKVRRVSMLPGREFHNYLVVQYLKEGMPKVVVNGQG